MLAGQEALEQELARAGLRTDAARGELIERIAARLNYATPTDLFAAIGFGDASAQSVANRMRDEVKHDNVVDLTKIGRKAGAPQERSHVERRANRGRRRRAGAPLEVLLAGTGRSDHRLRDDRTRRQRASRRLSQRRLHERNARSGFCKRNGSLPTPDLTHRVDIEVEADDRPQLLQDIMAVFAELKTQVSSVNARVRQRYGSR